MPLVKIEDMTEGQRRAFEWDRGPEMQVYYAAQERLHEMAKLVCPHCADGILLHDEVTDGQWEHRNWEPCAASNLHNIKTQLDDLRDQFFNPEYNPERRHRIEAHVGPGYVGWVKHE
jgi:hypothetical protein